MNAEAQGLRLNSKFRIGLLYRLLAPYQNDDFCMRKILLVIGILALSGCASNHSVSEFQCKAGDWESIGYRDGISGVSSTRILAHQEACGEFGIVPSRNSYMAGWQSGVREYCTADNGFNRGERGMQTNSICKGELREPFASAFENGRRLYLARLEVNRITKQLHNFDHRLEQIKHELVDLTAAQLNPKLLPEERIHMLAEMDSLRNESADIKAAIPQLEDDLYVSETELERINQELSRLSSGR